MAIFVLLFLFTLDYIGSSSAHTTTLGRVQWEDPFSPSPILVGQAEAFPLKSMTASLLRRTSTGQKGAAFGDRDDNEPSR